MIGHLKHDAQCEGCGRKLAAGAIVVGRNVPLSDGTNGWACKCGRCGGLISAVDYSTEGRAS